MAQYSADLFRNTNFRFKPSVKIAQFFQIFQRKFPNFNTSYSSSFFTLGSSSILRNMRNLRALRKRLIERDRYVRKLLRTATYLTIDNDITDEMLIYTIAFLWVFVVVSKLWADEIQLGRCRDVVSKEIKLDIIVAQVNSAITKPFQAWIITWISQSDDDLPSRIYHLS